MVTTTLGVGEGGPSVSEVVRRIRNNKSLIMKGGGGALLGPSLGGVSGSGVLWSLRLVQGLGFRVWCSGFMVRGVRFRF